MRRVLCTHDWHFVGWKRRDKIVRGRKVKYQEELFRCLDCGAEARGERTGAVWEDEKATS